MKMFDNDELAHLREADNCVSKGAVIEEANAHFTNKQYLLGKIILIELLELETIN